MNTEIRRSNAKAQLLETIAQFRRDQIAGKQPKSAQANPENVAQLESAAANLRAKARAA